MRDEFGHDGYGYGINAPLIYGGQLPANDRYEIKMTLPTPGANAVGYVQYVAATYAGVSGLVGDSNCTYYAVELRYSTICIRRQDIVSGAPSQTFLGCAGVSTPKTRPFAPFFRAAGSPATILVLVNNQLALRVTDANPLSGAPGVAMDLYSVNPGTYGVISEVDIGPWDTIPPNPVVCIRPTNPG